MKENKMGKKTEWRPMLGRVGQGLSVDTCVIEIALLNMEKMAKNEFGRTADREVQVLPVAA